MHSRKGSLTFGLSPARSRAGTRWSGLLILVSITILLSHRSNNSFWFFPPPPNERTCSTHPLNPSGVTSSNHSFYRTTIQHYPTDSLAQLPFPARDHSLRIQHDFSTNVPSYREAVVCKRRQAAVKATFEQYLSANRKDARVGKVPPVLTNENNMLIESLETFWIMGLTEEFEEAVAAITRMNLAAHGQVTSLLQTTRLLSSLLSAHDLKRCSDARFLSKAIELGDMLYTYFDTSNRLPITSWNSTKVANGEKQEVSQHTTPTELTAYNLVFVRLSQLTGDMRYYDAVKRVTTILASQQSSTKIPGLWPADINLQNLNLTSDTTFNLEATSNPAYAQYALMTHLLGIAPSTSPYTAITTSALDAIIQHLLFRPITPTNASIVVASSAYTSPKFHITRTHTIDAASCALGSTLALSAALTLNDTHLTYARLVTEGCIWTSLHAPLLSSLSSSSSPSSSSSSARIMPKSFSMLACSSADLKNSDEDCSFDPEVWPEQEYPGFEKIWDKKQETVRPEVVMSLFTLYRVTGEERWRDVGWQMWESVEQVVEERLQQSRNGNNKRDDDEFRMIVQTLKHFYLLFSEPNMLSLDTWVFTSDGGVLWAGNP